MKYMTLSQENTINLAQITEKDNIIKELQEALDAKKQECQDIVNKINYNRLTLMESIRSLVN